MAVRHSTFRTTSPSYFSSLKGLLLPGEEKTLQLTIFVSNTIAAPLNLRIERLSTLLIIHTLFGQDLFFSVGGEYGAGHCSSRFRWNRDPSLLCHRTLMLRNTSIRLGSFAGPYTPAEKSRGPPSRDATGWRAFTAGIHEANGLANDLRCRDCRMCPSQHPRSGPVAANCNSLSGRSIHRAGRRKFSSADARGQLAVCNCPA